MPLDLAPRIVETADGREVGYRCFGEGPPAVFLHASPRSAAVLLPLGEQLADRFTVYIFDTPGFGWSQPLRMVRPDAADFGHALIAAFDALGIGCAPLCHPSRISALALDGYALFTPVEQTEYAQFYLQPIRPDWAGMHLAWLWSRVKDQFTVFPWHLMGQWARLPRALLPPSAMQNVVVDFLAAGDAYRAAYAAAFRFDGAPAASALTTSTTVMARSDDLLFGHLDRFSRLPANVRVQRLGDDASEWVAAVRAAMTPGDWKPPQLPKVKVEFRGPAQAHRVVRVPNGTIECASSGRSDGRKIVFLPAMPGSVRGDEPLLRALGEHFPILAVNPPGFGASDVPDQAEVGAIAEAMLSALDYLAIQGFDIVAVEESASIGCEMVVRRPGSRLVLLDPLPDSVRSEIALNMTDITPRRDGSHLLAAWHQLRDRELWRPWYDARPAQALDCGTDPDVESLHAVFLDWMRGGMAAAATLRASMAPSLVDLIKPIAGRTGLITLPSHPLTEASALLAKGRGVRLSHAGDDRTDRARAICEALAP
jgi:pimeloyl-ACP methyl ester carboxylesterase